MRPHKGHDFSGRLLDLARLVHDPAQRAGTSRSSHHVRCGTAKAWRSAGGGRRKGEGTGTLKSEVARGVRERRAGRAKSRGGQNVIDSSKMTCWKFAPSGRLLSRCKGLCCNAMQMRCSMRACGRAGRRGNSIALGRREDAYRYPRRLDRHPYSKRDCEKPDERGGHPVRG